ncbi:MAG: hypothetical protein GWO02_18730 [Gammaproteobacteria bacterium]|nr:hypothetical protein [Gammaproteobacteria bacterium]
MQRIERLLGDRTSTRPTPLYETVYGVALVTVVCAIAASHHAIETLLGMLL